MRIKLERDALEELVLLDTFLALLRPYGNIQIKKVDKAAEKAHD